MAVAEAHHNWLSPPILVRHKVADRYIKAFFVSIRRCMGAIESSPGFLTFETCCDRLERPRGVPVALNPSLQPHSTPSDVLERPNSSLSFQSSLVPPLPALLCKMASCSQLVVMMLCLVIMYVGSTTLLTAGRPLVRPAMLETNCGPHGCLSPTLGAAGAPFVFCLVCVMVQHACCLAVSVIGSILAGEELGWSNSSSSRSTTAPLASARFDVFFNVKGSRLCEARLVLASGWPPSTKHQHINMLLLCFLVLCRPDRHQSVHGTPHQRNQQQFGACEWPCSRTQHQPTSKVPALYSCRTRTASDWHNGETRQTADPLHVAFLFVSAGCHRRLCQSAAAGKSFPAASTAQHSSSISHAPAPPARPATTPLLLQMPCST